MNVNVNKCVVSGWRRHFELMGAHTNLTWKMVISRMLNTWDFNTQFSDVYVHGERAANIVAKWKKKYSKLKQKHTCQKLNNIWQVSIYSTCLLIFRQATLRFLISLVIVFFPQNNEDKLPYIIYLRIWFHKLWALVSKLFY